MLNHVRISQAFIYRNFYDIYSEILNILTVYFTQYVGRTKIYFNK